MPPRRNTPQPMSYYVTQVASVIRLCLQRAYMPWNSAAQAVQHMLVASTLEQEQLVSRWVDSRIAELNMVAITAALVGSIMTALLSWSWFEPPPWPAKVATLAAVIGSLVAISVAAQQSIALSRANAHPKRVKNLLYVIAGVKEDKIEASRYQLEDDQRGSSPFSISPLQYIPPSLSASRIQCFVWQISTMLLGSSIMFGIIGLLIAVYDSAVKANEGIASDEAKIAVTVSIPVAFYVISYFISWWNVEGSLQELSSL